MSAVRFINKKRILKRSSLLFFFCVAISVLSFFTRCKKEVSAPGALPSLKQRILTANLAATKDPSEVFFNAQLNALQIPEPERPALIWSSAGQPLHSDVTPAIFYSPHQDDETLGMGASIAESARKGRPTYVVLLSDGASPANAAKLGMTPEEYIKERMREFIAACQALGAHRVYISSRGSGFSDLQDKAALTPHFKNTMRYFSVLYPKAAHRTVSGNCDVYNRSCDRHPTHQAATDAIHQLYSENSISDVSLFRVYMYYHHFRKKDHTPCTRKADVFKPMDARDQLLRLNAFGAYRNDADNKLGIGYWSVQALFDQSQDAEHEYIDLIENDCR